MFTSISAKKRCLHLLVPPARDIYAFHRRFILLHIGA